MSLARHNLLLKIFCNMNSIVGLPIYLYFWVVASWLSFSLGQKNPSKFSSWPLNDNLLFNNSTTFSKQSMFCTQQNFMRFLKLSSINRMLSKSSEVNHSNLYITPHNFTTWLYISLDREEPAYYDKL
jgi:hypothetical protein